MKKNNALFIVALVLLIAGAATLVYGIIAYNDASKALMPSLSKAFTGSSQEGDRAITFMLVGGGVALIGLLLLLFPKLRKR